MRRLALGLATVALAVVYITTVMPVEAQPTPTPTSTATPTPTPSPTPTATATSTVQVWIDFPDAPGMNVTLEVYPGHDFVVRTNISHVYRLKNAQYDITYNSSVLVVERITDWVPMVRKGIIGGEDYLIEQRSFVPKQTQGRVRVLQNVEGFDWRTGEGYMSRIFFHVNGSPGQTSPIRIDIETLGNYLTQPIVHTTINSTVIVIAPTPSPTPTPSSTPTPTASATPTCRPGDADFDGVIDAGDITKVERMIMGWDAETPCGDANGDGTVNTTDIGVIEYMILDIWPWNHVHVEAPASLPHCTNFTADVFVTYVEDFSTAQFVVTYNTSVLDWVGVTEGRLLAIDAGVSAEFHPVGIDDWGLAGGPGAVRINASVGGAAGVDGSGYLARLQFHANGSAGQGSPIALNASQSWLRDNLGGDINATWAGDWFTVAP
jgi:hypothetical protein